MRNISNSETQAWLTCRAKYRYAYDMVLAPNKESGPISRGVLGHTALELYYKQIMDGAPVEDAQYAVNEFLTEVITNDSDPDTLATCTQLREILNGYFAYYTQDNWEILAVEESYELPISSETNLVSKLDLVIKDRATNKIVIVDHKFQYDFPNQDDLNLNAQLPKYLAIVRATGLQVDYAMLNVLRTRKLKTGGPQDQYQRFTVNPSTAKIRNALTFHRQVGHEINSYLSMDTEDRPIIAVPTLNKMVCRGCSYSPLCSAEYDGGEIEFLIEQDYRKNEYALNNNPEASDD